MVYAKVSYGCVIQTFDNETGDCIAAQFVPDGRVERQTEAGDPISAEAAVELQNMEKESPIDMVQP